MKHSHTNSQNRSIDTEHEPESGDAASPRIGRRNLLIAGGAAGLALIAGCSGGQSNGGEPPAPVSLAASAECDVCGMVISEHPGPNGQIFYREHSPESHDNPAWFDSPKSCLFPYFFDHKRRDWTASAVYVTDYSAVDYDISVINGQKYIQTATTPETFSDAETVVFVVGSDVHGAMGPDFIPFSDKSDGSSFADEYNGRIVPRDEIGSELLG